MADKEMDVSRGKDGKVKVAVDSSIEVDIVQRPGAPVSVPGRNITWVAFFDVKKKNKAGAQDTVSYKIKVSGLSNFVFWDGGQPQFNQNWTSKDLTGDPAIGLER